MRSFWQDRANSPTRRVLSVMRWPVGGIRTYILCNYPYLMESGYRFTFLGPADRSFHALRQELADWPDVEFVEAPLKGRQCRLWKTVRQELRTDRYDLVHSQGMTAAAHVAFARWRRGVPHVTTCHDVVRREQVRGLMGRGKRWLLDRLIRGVDVTVAVTEDVRENLR